MDPKKLRRAIGLSRCRLISLQESVLEYLESVCEQLRQQGHFVEVTTVGSNEMKDIIREIAEEAHKQKHRYKRGPMPIFNRDSVDTRLVARCAVIHCNAW